jgi:hypothetical protein
MTTELLDRLDRLEKIEALKLLKHRYAAACDDNYDAALIASLFTEDGLWDGGDAGRYEGRDAIFATFNSQKFAFKHVYHFVTNPIIDINEDRASCLWYLLLVKINKDDSTSRWVGNYDDQCVLEGGRWLFKKLGLKLYPLTGT